MVRIVTKEELQAKLSSYGAIDLSLTINNNQSTYLSVWKRPKKHLAISLHKLFLSAPEEILQSIVEYAVKGKKKALAPLRRYAHDYFQNIDQSHLLQKKELKTKGLWVDLQEIYHRLNKRYFSDELSLTISWFEKPKYKRFSSVTFGSYTRHLRWIRINSLLDHPKVPLYFIEFIVYHEMLHDICPPYVDRAGRVRVHTSLFKKKEKIFPWYEQAKEWEKKFLHKRGKL